jgi:26S proteasome regulatory subunit N5
LNIFSIQIPEAKELAKKNLTEALEMLIILEKQTRTGADMHSTAKVLVCIVQICYEVSDVTIFFHENFRRFT